MSKFATLFALAALLPAFTKAAVPVWGQCGGQGYNGDTTCASGSTCVVSNPFYSQCLPSNQVPTTTNNPGTTTTQNPTTTTGPVPTPTVTPDAGNPFVGYDWYLSPYYAAEVDAAAALITDATVKAKALKVKQIPTFIWFDVIAKTGDLGTYLADASAQQKATGKKLIVPIVVYDLPDRDCAAAASNGEFSIANGGEANYRRYIDQLVAQIKKYPDVRVIAAVEPDSLANMVTNMSVAKCAGAANAYKAGIIYAVQQLNALGVYMYIDAGHAGWLGWTANLSPAAQLYAQLFKDAGSPKFLRGLATNVSNYNALNAASPDPVTQGNANYDEQHYINALAPLLQQGGFPAHFIVDQSRSGVQNIRNEWGDWCNVRGAGFGLRPSTNTGSTYIDSIVWVKPGGEADGTSDTSAARYDTHCGVASAHKPAPEAGTWFQDYFVNLVKNANPPL